MEPLQVIALVSGTQAQHRALEAMPGAPTVALTGREVTGRKSVSVRAGIARVLRTTADRVDPCPAPTAG